MKVILYERVRRYRHISVFKENMSNIYDLHEKANRKKQEVTPFSPPPLGK